MSLHDVLWENMQKLAVDCRSFDEVYYMRAGKGSAKERSGPMGSDGAHSAGRGGPRGGVLLQRTEEAQESVAPVHNHSALGMSWYLQQV